MDNESLIRLCRTSFTTREIEDAKSLLFESVRTDKRKISRRSDERYYYYYSQIDRSARCDRNVKLHKTVLFDIITITSVVNSILHVSIVNVKLVFLRF